MGALGALAVAPAAAGRTPTIRTDRADYAPGDTVTISGSGWAPGEAVRISVNDDDGQTWSRVASVTADAAGEVTDTFALPDWFVATYAVTATGSSGTATTTFTDGSMRAVAPPGEQFTLTRTVYAASATCEGPGTTTTVANVGTIGSTVNGLTAAQSLRLVASATATSSAPFDSATGWTTGNDPTGIVSTSTTSVANDTICVVGSAPGEDRTYQANYVSDTAPRVAGSEPPDGSAGVAVDADLAIEFGEAVTLTETPSWITVTCSSSGAHAGTTGASGTLHTFDPTVDFAYGEECTATVHASGVHDADAVDPPDQMAADVEISFTTVAAPPDGIAPVVMVAHSAAGDAGWNTTTPVAVRVAATDNVRVTSLGCTVGSVDTALAPVFAPAPAYDGALAGGLSGDGVHTVTCAARDLAGNRGSATDTVRIDTIAPVSSVTGFTAGHSFVKGVDALPSAGCTTVDPAPGSGVDRTATVDVNTTGLDANGVGTVVVTCDGGTDAAGNGDVPASASYAIVYGGIGGILPPIRSDGTGLFHRGRTVPVKFTLAGDAPGGFATTGWAVERKPVACAGAFDGPDAAREVVPSGAPAGLRYDADADQYAFDADLRDVPAGTCWRLRAAFGNGQATPWSGAFRLTR
jgi:hypothetical protein